MTCEEHLEPADGFRILGPLEVRVGGRSVALRSPKQRSLLAALLLATGRTVPAEGLVTHLWGDDLPTNGRSALQIHVTRLRQALDSAGMAQPVRTMPDGYRIDVAREALDLHRFQDAVQDAALARRRGDLAVEAALLTEARACWLGAALADVPSDSLQREVVPALTEQLLEVSERYFEVSLMLGRHHRIVPQLRAMTAEHPYRECFWRQLMLALYRCDRRAEALEAFRELKWRLNHELGIDPVDRLSLLHQAILRGDETLNTGAA